jgi:hypothetical protein
VVATKSEWCVGGIVGGGYIKKCVSSSGTGNEVGRMRWRWQQWQRQQKNGCVGGVGGGDEVGKMHWRRRRRHQRQRRREVDALAETAVVAAVAAEKNGCFGGFGGGGEVGMMRQLCRQQGRIIVLELRTYYTTL